MTDFSEQVYRAHIQSARSYLERAERETDKKLIVERINKAREHLANAMVALSGQLPKDGVRPPDKAPVPPKPPLVD